MAFFGELYLRSTLPFLPRHVTAAEVDYLVQAFGSLNVGGPILDLACGHGRHADPLQRRLTNRAIVGLDFDAGSLHDCPKTFSRVRADMRALPFRQETFAGVYVWYSSLFIFTEDVHRQLLTQLAKLLKPGGRLVLHSSPLEFLRKVLTTSFEDTLPDGSRVLETTSLDSETGWVDGKRTLHLPDGRVLAGEYRIRYHSESDLRQLLESVGFSVKWVHGGCDGTPLSSESTDLIVGADVPHG